MKKLVLGLIVTLLEAVACQSVSLPTAVPTTSFSPSVIPTTIQPKPLGFDHRLLVLPALAYQERLAKWRYLADSSDELSVAQLTADQTQGKSILTRTEAEDDAKYLFLLFKHGYSGYGFYNENSNWERAQAALLQDFAMQETISTSEFESDIAKQLAFINDGHIGIGKRGLFQHQDYWYWDGMDFIKEGERYWSWGSDGKQWLETIDGKPAGDSIKYALNSQGDPVYQLGKLATRKPDDFTLEFMLADGTRIEQTGAWKRAPFPSDGTLFSRTAENGIPVIVNRTLSGDAMALKNFQEDAKQVQNAGITILDLRGNDGGDSGVAQSWMRNLTGRNPQSPYISTILETRTTFVGKLNLESIVPQTQSPLDYKSLVNQLDSGARKRGWTSIQVPQPSVIPNPRHLLVVLTDGRICSSGEWFLGYLKQLENVVFVGENSRGCRPFGDITYYQLPNSRIQIVLTNRLFLETDLSNVQGIGYLPDLWVPADKALLYTLAATKRGWLQAK